MVADARAGDDAGIRELDGGADAPEALRRQRVDGNDKVGAHGLHRAAHELGGLQSRCAEDAGRQHADIRERTEGGAALQVARGGHMIGGAGADDVGRHGAVAESDHEGGIDRSFEESAQLVAERERRALRVRGVLGRKRAQVERDVGAPRGLPRAREAASPSTVTVVTAQPRRVRSVSVRPSMASSLCAARNSACASSARSVRRAFIKPPAFH